MRGRWVGRELDLWTGVVPPVSCVFGTVAKLQSRHRRAGEVSYTIPGRAPGSAGVMLHSSEMLTCLWGRPSFGIIIHHKHIWIRFRRPGKGPAMTSSPDGEESVEEVCAVCGADVPLDTLPPARNRPCFHCGHLTWFRKRGVNGIVVLDVLSARGIGGEQMECVSQALVDCSGLPRIVLNLSELKFASSSFIAGLVSLHKKVRVAGGKLVLCELRPVMVEILEGARLNKLFDITEDEENALAKFVGVDD